jgi:hypothetical protein
VYLEQPWFGVVNSLVMVAVFLTFPLQLMPVIKVLEEWCQCRNSQMEEEDEQEEDSCPTIQSAWRVWMVTAKMMPRWKMMRSTNNNRHHQQQQQPPTTTAANTTTTMYNNHHVQQPRKLIQVFNYKN